MEVMALVQSPKLGKDEIVPTRHFLLSLLSFSP